jgi:hypothetical protein
MIISFQRTVMQQKRSTSCTKPGAHRWYFCTFKMSGMFESKRKEKEYILSKKDCVQKVHNCVQKNDTCECRKERRHMMCWNGVHKMCRKWLVAIGPFLHPIFPAGPCGMVTGQNVFVTWYWSRDYWIRSDWSIRFVIVFRPKKLICIFGPQINK